MATLTPGAPTPRPSHPRAAELWLAARAARSAGDTDRAVVLLEQAATLAPSDEALLATYAETLVLRSQERETPSAELVEARAMAAEVLGRTPALDEAWLAHGVALLELGEPVHAAKELLRVRPGEPSRDAVIGRMLLDAGDGKRAVQHLRRARALVTARLDSIYAALLAGDRGAAGTPLLAEDRTPAAWLLSARAALWHGDAARARTLRARLPRPLEHGHRIEHLLDAAEGKTERATLDAFAWLAESDPRAARRASQAREIEAELAAASGDLSRALDAVEAAVSCAGFFDLGWLDGCPLLEPLRAAPRFRALRARVAEVAVLVAEVLASE